MLVFGYEEIQTTTLHPINSARDSHVRIRRNRRQPWRTTDRSNSDCRWSCWNNKHDQEKISFLIQSIFTNRPFYSKILLL